jgi:hypothetical protein
MQSTILSFEHPGIHYFDFFELLNLHAEPRTYFEIGTNTGNSIEKFTCDVVCVDPKFLIERNVFGLRRRSFFFQMTSDNFFRSETLSTYFSNGPDIAFLDGMHLFEFLLKDFINTEKACHKRSVVLMHDCLPLSSRMAERGYRGGSVEEGTYQWAWTGDVWKMLPILKRYRPDLHVRLVDCPPTGVVAISNLNPTSTVLSDNFESILAEYAKQDLDHEQLVGLRTMFPMVDSRMLHEQQNLVSAYFNCR